MSNHYTYRAEWSPEDDEYVGLVAEFPSLSWLAPTAAEAIAGVAQLVTDILADMEETGETPPVPLTERRYSGNISVRTTPDQHRQLSIEAAEQGVSVNQWITQKLAAARNELVHQGRFATARTLLDPDTFADTVFLMVVNGEKISASAGSDADRIDALREVRGVPVTLSDPT